MSSVSGALWDDLYFLYFAIAAVVGFAVVAWLFYNLWAFRWRPDRPRPADAPRAGMISVERGHPLWSYVMAGLIALIMFGLAFGTISAVNTLENPPPCDGRECLFVNVTGSQFAWSYEYAGETLEGGLPFSTAASGRARPAVPFTVPVDTPVVLNITSSDVWHNFAIPDFRIRVDAIPGTVNPLWFQATETGEFRNVCVVICGYDHAIMNTHMVVVTQEEWTTFKQQRADEGYAKLLRDYTRTPTSGTALNVTIGDGSLDLSRDNFTASRPIVVFATNEGTAPATLTIGDRSATVAPGSLTRLYLVAPAIGSLEVSANGETRTLEVSQ